MKIDTMNLAELRRFIDEARAELTALATRGDSLTGVDADIFETREAELKAAIARKEQLEQRAEQIKAEVAAGTRQTEFGSNVGGSNFDSARPVANRNADPLKGAQLLTRDQSFVDWNRSNGLVPKDDEQPSFGKFVRGLATGDWDGAEQERAMSVGSATAGGHLVNPALSGQVLDLARNSSKVFAAGATAIPMATSTLKIARLATDPGPTWRAENAPVTVNDLVFDSVNLVAKDLSRIVVLSQELFADSDPSIAGVIEQAFAASFGQALDLAALRGSGSGAEPLGLKNQPGVTTIAHGANGAAVDYDFLLDAAGTVRSYNFEPNAHIVASRSLTSLSKKKDSQGNYLTRPADLLPILSTNQVPVNGTTGTSTDTSEIYTGAWPYLGIGIRQSLQIQFLKERYADNGQVAFAAHLRADVVALQPKAFVVDTGVRG